MHTALPRRQPPRACNIELSFTLWFNVLFYVLLFRALRTRATERDRQLWKGVAVHALPFWVTSQYVVWYSQIYKKCNRPLPVVVVSDLLWHWLLLGVAVYFLRQMCDVEPDWTCGTLGLGVGLITLYMVLARFAGTWSSIRGMYDVPFWTLAGVYTPFLIVSIVVIRAMRA